MLAQTGLDNINSSNKRIIDKLHSKEKKWKVLNPDEDNESDLDSEGNIKIKDFDEEDE